MADLFDVQDAEGLDPFGGNDEPIDIPSNEDEGDLVAEVEDDGPTTEEDVDDGEAEDHEEDHENLDDNGDDLDFIAQDEPLPQDDPLPAPTDTPLSKWEQERKIVLQERREASRQLKKDGEVQAKKDIEKFHEDRTSTIASRAERNRKEEANSLADLESVMEHGTLWEKVGRLVDLTPKAGQTYAREDLSRMRTLLIQLKNEQK